MLGAGRSEWSFHSQAPQQRRHCLLLATLRDGGDLGAPLCHKPLVVGGTTARLASRATSQISPVADAKLVLTGPRNLAAYDEQLQCDVPPRLKNFSSFFL